MSGRAFVAARDELMSRSIPELARYGFRRTDQMKAERLLISAASAIRSAGLRTSMTSDSELDAPSMFPIRS